MESARNRVLTRRRIGFGLAQAGLAIFVLVMARWSCWHDPQQRVDRQNETRQAFSEWLNTDQSVRYVGDAACRDCHESKCANYHQHPMGRSMASPGGVAPTAGPNEPFNLFGLKYRVTQRGNRIFHQEICEDSHGKALFTQEAEVSAVVGSGQQGKSYLIEREGFLFQSPISWFAQMGRWGPSPGYAEKTLHFDRPITELCLFCHCNQVTAVPHSVNRYRTPIFNELAIGCERCHGPGELHVTSRNSGESPDGIDHTIVNPRHLSPPVRDAICEQCHLQGEARALRRGRSYFDYRPGLALQDFMTVYVRPPALTQGRRAVNHVEQMAVSRCFQASDGKLGCISCHDPHLLPDSGGKREFYRNRCRQCHVDSACSESVETRHKQNNDSCYECHMPRSESANIVHMAVSDHRIIRKKGHSPTVPAWLQPTDIPIIPFHERLNASPPDDRDRDLGIAMVDIARRPGPEAVRRQICIRAEPLLAIAVQRHPDDIAALSSHAFTLWRLNRLREALAEYKTVLELAPDAVVPLEEAARVSTQIGQIGPALQLWERLTANAPHRSLGHFEMAQIFSLRGDWPAVRGKCQDALQRNASHAEARALLGRAYWELGETGKAETELGVLQILNQELAIDLRQRLRQTKPH